MENTDSKPPFQIQSFAPVPTCQRHDGWTPKKLFALIEALATSGCVDGACRRVGRSRQSAYDLRTRPEAGPFREAWEAALEHGVKCMADAAFSRAIHGVGYGEDGEGYVRIAMVENEHRLRQAARNIKRYLQSMGVNTPTQAKAI